MRPARPVIGQPLSTSIARLARSTERLLFLDYDGTLVPFAAAPHLAHPDLQLLALLTRLGRLPRTAVHIISGRDRVTLDAWLGHLPVGVHAEHGYWSRLMGQGEWTATATVSTHWRSRVRTLMQHVAARTPGSLIEEKSVSLAFHYRTAEPGAAALAIPVLRQRITGLRREDLEVLEGSKVLEVRPLGMNKRRVVKALLGTVGAGTAVMAAGENLTHEDLFAALPAEAICVQVGAAALSSGHVRAADPAELRQALQNLADLIESSF